MMHPTIDVRIENASEIDRELRDELERWTDAQFGHLPYKWAPSEWYVIARLDDQVVGSLTLVTRQVTAAAESILIGGIGNVVTKPEYRLRGVASAMLRAAADLMRTRLDAEFGVLICHRDISPVYERNGWIRVEGPTRFWQPAGTTTYLHDTMVLKLTAREWPGGPIDLCGLPW